MLLLMVWVHRLQTDAALRGISQLNEQTRRRTLGFITLIHWFSPDPAQCVRRLGSQLLVCGAENLESFFNADRFSELLQSDPQQKRMMYGVPGVAQLLQILDAHTCEEPKKDALWDLYCGAPSADSKAFSEALGTERVTREIQQNAVSILEKVCEEKRLVLYAQREYVKKWFDWFDPTRVSQVTDHNAPWDFDHILPWSWVANERISTHVPYSTRIWVRSNGNFRAWPAESNRSKGNYRLLEDELPVYGLDDSEAVYKASFIRNRNDWQRLAQLQGHDDFWKEPKNPKDPDSVFAIFSRAAKQRTVDIYREWHEALCIGELCPKPVFDDIPIE